MVFLNIIENHSSLVLIMFNIKIEIIYLLILITIHVKNKSVK
jgi:hypothetical protein